ncbi:hypothetical protein UA08_03769 [Talaromyces atroroseus]|uniref:Uncharacterized protein n=1 Tax=Talaromyces atroroseus TaxID=1441469 RepID=A0A225B6R7_TALAT|nr:hypothetical protein UA08_03769 [Talaromyces atroroseus]OKL61607.1 hypothetical protein UA08_03769 [Talaromyces atroroseus]
MGRQSLRSPFPIAVRTSSINAETVMYDEKPLSRNAMRNQMPQPDSFSRELRVRASSPLLGRSYHSSQPSAQPPFRTLPEAPQLPQLHQSGSFADFAHDKDFEKYALDSQSQRNLAFGVVEDMRGIGFPHLEQGSNRVAEMVEESMNGPPKRKPSRLDLSLLFPKPKPAAAPLLSPQRYTHSPSPVTSEHSVKPAPTKLSKPRSKGNMRISFVKEIPEERLPPTRQRASQKPMDWFDVPLEKIIRLGDSLDVEDMQAGDHDDADDQGDQEVEPPAHKINTQTTKKVHQPPAIESRPKTISTRASSATGSERSTFTSSSMSRRVSRDNRSSRHHPNRQQIPSQSASRVPGSLQTWQSEGDLRSSQKRGGRLSKKKSSSTFMSSDLTKTSVLSLSSSESESEDEKYTSEDEYEGELILSRAAPSRTSRDSFATNDYLDPEICRAEAVVATRTHSAARLDRTHSNVSSTSSTSRSTMRRPTRSRADSLSSAGRSSVSGKMFGSSGHFNAPLIEEPEEQKDEASGTGRPQQCAPRTRNDIHSAKRRSRIIAVTRQEESLLEAMRLRNGRITPSIFNDIESNAPHSGVDSRSSSVPPRIRSPESIQTEFDTSFLRLSTAMRLPPGSPPAAGENTSSREQDTSISLGSASDSEQKTDSTNYTSSPRLSLAYSETPSSTSTIGHMSPVTPPTLSLHRFSPRAPPPSHAPPPIPQDVARRHSRRRTDSSEAIVLADSESDKTSDPPYPLWAVKWGRDPHDLTFVH